MRFPPGAGPTQSNAGGPGAADPQTKPSVAGAGGGCGCGEGEEAEAHAAEGELMAAAGRKLRPTGSARNHGRSNELVEVCRCLLVLH